MKNNNMMIKLSQKSLILLKKCLETHKPDLVWVTSIVFPMLGGKRTFLTNIYSKLKSMYLMKWTAHKVPQKQIIRIQYAFKESSYGY